MSDSMTLTQADLKQFTGTKYWYRHPFNRKVFFTDGVKYVADVGIAYWLLDEIVLVQRFYYEVAQVKFQVWKLTVLPECKGILTCEDGNGNEVFRKKIEFTDFPLDEITLFLICGVILLPSEY